MHSPKAFLNDYLILPKGRFECIIAQDDEALYRRLRKNHQTDVQFIIPRLKYFSRCGAGSFGLRSGRHQPRMSLCRAALNMKLLEKRFLNRTAPAPAIHKINPKFLDTLPVLSRHPQLLLAYSFHHVLPKFQWLERHY